MLGGRRRSEAAARFARELTLDDVPVAVFAQGGTGELFSARIGCIDHNRSEPASIFRAYVWPNGRRNRSFSLRERCWPSYLETSPGGNRIVGGLARTLPGGL